MFPNVTKPFNIGAGRDYGDGYWFKGDLDDIAIWNRALDSEEVLDWYNGVQLGGPSSVTIRVSKDLDFKAQFGTGLSFKALGKGEVKVQPELDLYPYGSSVSVSAVPEDGFSLMFWAGANTSSQPLLNHVVTEPNPTLTAVFGALPSGKASLSVEISGNGKVSVDPNKNLYDIGESVMITAEVLDGPFLGYTGDSDQKEAILAVKIDKNTTITANFADFNKGLVAYYPFNGNANDESGNGNDGTVNGATLDEDRNGEAGKAYSFDGNNTYIIVPHNKVLNFEDNSDFTISLWALDDFAIGKSNGGGDTSKWTFSLNMKSFHINDPSLRGRNLAVISSDLEIHSWSNIVIRKKANEFKIFRDGKVLSIETNSSSLPLGITGSMSIGIEEYIDTGVKSILGKMDDIRVYNRALSEAEVTALHDLEKPKPTLTTGLVAYYPFNGNANDEGRNDWHGVVQGATFAEDRNNNAKSAIEFNGSGVVDLGSSNLFQPVLNDDYSIISWIYLAEDQNSTFLSFGDDYGSRSNQYFRLNFGLNKSIGITMRGEGGEGKTFAISTEKNAIKLTQWHLLHITKKKEEEGTNISLYIDGKRLINSTNYQAGKVNPRNNHNLILGADEVPRRRYFKGALDDLRFYSRALSEDEIAEFYELEKPTAAGDATPPVITLSGEVKITIETGAVYLDAGATALDNVDGSVSVATSGSVDTDTPGTYTLTYAATDASGNTAAATRTVTVVQFSEPTIETDLLAYYPFNGNANDESGNGNDGKVNGATLAVDRNGETGKAYSFDGEDHIKIDTRFDGMRNATLSFWFKGDEKDQPRQRVTFVQTASIMLMLQNMADNHVHHGHKILVFYHDDRNGNSSKPWSSERLFVPKFKQDAWNQIVVRIDDSDNCYLTMNGENIALQSSNRDLPSGVYVDSLIGGADGGTGVQPGIRGLMDDIRIYNRALSDAEVTALYELEKPTGGGGTTEPAVLSISPGSGSFGSGAGSGEIAVSASGGAEWTARSDSSWITVTDGAGTIDSFETHKITTSADGAISVHAADVDGDGDMDVLSASMYDDTIAWYKNDGSEKFTTQPIVTLADRAISVRATDVDGDGDVDVLSASEYDDRYE